MNNPTEPREAIPKAIALANADSQCGLYLETLASKTVEIEALRNFLNENRESVPESVAKTIHDMIWITRCTKPL